MIDAEKLTAFALVTGLTSLVPGASMLFVLSQSVWRGARSGATALLGLQFGYILWWILAALGLGTLAAAFPIAFRILAIGGALYIAWLGIQALRDSRTTAASAKPAREPTAHALRDGLLVALGNPKSLIYIIAVLPPFVDPDQHVAGQLIILAIVAMSLDLMVGSLYIVAGTRLARLMTQGTSRQRLDMAVGAIFLAISAAILIGLLRDGS